MTKQLAISQNNESILTIRGHRVMLDKDVAAALGDEAKVINQNASRSPKWEYLRSSGLEAQYRFQLTQEECEILRSQFVTMSEIKYLPWVYTQKGCAFFGTSMNSPAACAQAVQLVEVFDKARQIVEQKKLDPIAFMEAQIVLMKEMQAAGERFERSLADIAIVARQDNDTLTHTQISELDAIIHEQYKKHKNGMVAGLIKRQIKEAFFEIVSTRTYKEIPRNGFERACEIARDFIPPAYLFKKRP
jgi:hypothetical protein